jgi:hypothetical protein
MINSLSMYLCSVQGNTYAEDLKLFLPVPGLARLIVSSFIWFACAEIFWLEKYPPVVRCAGDCRGGRNFVELFSPFWNFLDSLICFVFFEL